MSEGYPRKKNGKRAALLAVQRDYEKQQRKVLKNARKVADGANPGATVVQSSSHCISGQIQGLLDVTIPNDRTRQVQNHTNFLTRSYAPLDFQTLEQCRRGIEKKLGLQFDDKFVPGTRRYALSSSEQYPSTANIPNAQVVELKRVTDFLLSLPPSDFFSPTCYYEGLQRQTVLDSVSTPYDECLQQIGMQSQKTVEAALQDPCALYGSRSSSIVSKDGGEKTIQQQFVQALSQPGSLIHERVVLTSQDVEALASMDVTAPVSSAEDDLANQPDYKLPKEIACLEKSDNTLKRRAVSSECEIFIRPIVQDEITNMIQKPHLFDVLDPKDVNALPNVALNNSIHGTTPYIGMPRHRQPVIIEDCTSPSSANEPVERSDDPLPVTFEKEQAMGIVNDFLQQQDVGFIETVDPMSISDETAVATTSAVEEVDGEESVMESGRIQLYDPSHSSGEGIPSQEALSATMGALGSYFHQNVWSNVGCSNQSELARLGIISSIIEHSARSAATVLPFSPSTLLPSRVPVEVPRSIEESMMRECLPGSHERPCSKGMSCEGHIISSYHGVGFQLVSAQSAIASLARVGGISQEMQNVFDRDICILCYKCHICTLIFNLKSGLRGPLMPSVVVTTYINIVGRPGEYTRNDCWHVNPKTYDGVMGPFAKYCRNNYARDRMSIGDVEVNSLKQVMNAVQLYDRVNFPMGSKESYASR